MARSASLDGFRMSRPGGYAGIMLLFLGIIGIFVWIQQEFVLDFFDNNATLNGMILGVLAFGILYCFAQVLGLGSSARWVEQIRLRDPGRSSAGRSVPSLLAPMAAMLRDPQGPMELSPFAMRSILDSIGTRLDESRENSRYMIGLLIFLGLLGTFWGLLQTIGAVGDTVSNLTPDGSAGSNIFEQLKTGLEAP
ncbi:MAG: flagellar motor protein MotA, partial [Pseudomonadota bacterium]